MSSLGFYDSFNTSWHRINHFLQVTLQSLAFTIYHRFFIELLSSEFPNHSRHDIVVIEILSVVHPSSPSASYFLLSRINIYILKVCILSLHQIQNWKSSVWLRITKRATSILIEKFNID